MLQHLRQPPVAVRPHDQIDRGNLLEEYRPQPLGHAPDHAQDPAGALVALQFANPADDALFGMIAHRAGVDEDDVGPGGIGFGRVAVLRQHTEHQFGVGHVHLASVGFDIDPLQPDPHRGRVTA